jgi:hypothetical protein
MNTRGKAKNTPSRLRRTYLQAVRAVVEGFVPATDAGADGVVAGAMVVMVSPFRG